MAWFDLIIHTAIHRISILRISLFPYNLPWCMQFHRLCAVLSYDVLMCEWHVLSSLGPSLKWGLNFSEKWLAHLLKPTKNAHAQSRSRAKHAESHTLERMS